MKVCNPFGLDAFELILWLVEHVAPLVGVIVCLLATTWQCSPPSTNGKGSSSSSNTTTTKKEKPTTGAAGGWQWRHSAYVILGTLPALIVVLVVSVFACSWEDAWQRNYDLALPSLRSQLEAYIVAGSGNAKNGVAAEEEMEDDADFLHEILESDTYAPTFGIPEVRYVLKDLLAHTTLHLDSHNEDNIDEGYNKGNDWFTSFLGPETMTYTSGIYPTGNETLEQAQNAKIDFVANAIELKPNDNVLDIGCGWTYMTKQFTEKYGARVSAVTLSREQYEYGTKLNHGNGAKIYWQDAMKIPIGKDDSDNFPRGGFNKITSLEMAEHVGIRRYQEFLKLVHALLADDGVFYFQVAGLRRNWRFEDLVWGLFMGEHIFPGADASCPLGWVTTQLERAGFEVQRVHNLGSHYSRTLAHWLENWRSNKAYLVKKYGAVAYRRWEVFLAWSTRIARQGSSTVFMLTLTKAGQEGRRIQTQKHFAKDLAASSV